VGAARKCTELAAAFASERVQFGRAVGGFQGVKHKLADALVEVELATSAVYLAACHVAAGDDAAASASAPLALFAAAEAFDKAAAACVQVHGGIGFTWEHDAQFFVKRARSNRQLLGRPGQHLARVYELAGSTLA
jgi:alkylation response protein AidB-like acyl-CoA dehydrogenase